MILPKTKRFLVEQAKRLHQLDLAEGLANHPNIRPVEEDGQVLDGMQVLYQNAINYLGSREAQKVLYAEQALIEASINEATLATDVSGFTTSYLPLVRRTYRNLIAKELCAVQPLKNPSGYVFWLSKQYHSAHVPDGIGAGDDIADVPGAKTYGDSSELGTIREVDAELQDKLIEVKTQKLAFNWTWESQEKLRSALGLDLESEMSVELADELAREQDRYVIDAMIAGVGFTANWNQNGWAAGDLSTFERREYAKTLVSTAMVSANAYVLGKTYRSCDFCVMNADTFALIQKLEDFKLDQAFAQKPTVGINKVGVINGWLEVYLDPGMAANKILMGVKSRDWKNTSTILAPYISLYFSPVFISGGNDFTNLKKGLASQWWAGVVGKDKNATTSDYLTLINITSS